LFSQQVTQTPEKSTHENYVLKEKNINPNYNMRRYGGLEKGRE